MRFTLPTALVATALVLGGCSGGPGDPAADASRDSTTAPSTAAGAEPDQGLPPDAVPAADRTDGAECPYLDTQWVAETNGQRVTGVGTDTRFDIPACLFWSYPEEPQLTVVVRHTRTPEEARAVVDAAAPVDVTDPASDPAGWNGGRAGGGRVPGHLGAVYSVAKETVAVSVWTNQQESVKAQAIAEETISRLGLP